MSKGLGSGLGGTSKDVVDETEDDAADDRSVTVETATSKDVVTDPEAEARRLSSCAPCSSCESMVQCPCSMTKLRVSSSRVSVGSGTGAAVIGAAARAAETKHASTNPIAAHDIRGLWKRETTGLGPSGSCRGTARAGARGRTEAIIAFAARGAGGRRRTSPGAAVSGCQRDERATVTLRAEFLVARASKRGARGGSGREERPSSLFCFPLIFRRQAGQPRQSRLHPGSWALVLYRARTHPPLVRTRCVEGTKLWGQWSTMACRVNGGFPGGRRRRRQ